MKIIQKFLLIVVIITTIVSCDNDHLGEIRQSTDPSLITKHAAPGKCNLFKVAECGQVTLKWEHTFRASSYDVYMNNELLVKNTTDTFFIHTEAPSVDQIYSVRSNNQYGSSEGTEIYASQLITPDPVSKYGLWKVPGVGSLFQWKKSLKAQYYNLSVGDVVVAEKHLFTGVTVDNALSGVQKFGIQSANDCGSSDWAYFNVDLDTEGKDATVTTQKMHPNLFTVNENVHHDPAAEVIYWESPATPMVNVIKKANMIGFKIKYAVHPGKPILAVLKAYGSNDGKTWQEFPVVIKNKRDEGAWFEIYDALPEATLLGEPVNFFKV